MKTCSTCCYWRRAEPDIFTDNELAGNCTRNPPQIISHKRTVKSSWPITMHYMICGEHQGGGFIGAPP